MKCSTHITVGAFTGALYSAMVIQNPTMTLPTIILSAVGGMIPDIDSKTSFISNALVVPKFLPLKHRGITHSFPVTALVYVVNPALGIGYLSHILIDLLNKRKVSLLLPFSNKKYALGLVKSNGKFDEFIKNIAMLGTIIILFA